VSVAGVSRPLARLGRFASALGRIERGAGAAARRGAGPGGARTRTESEKVQAVSFK